MTEQAPVPLVIVKLAPVFEQEPELENVTAPPGAVAATEKPLLKTAEAGAWVVTVIAWSALFTVNEFEPELGLNVLSPGNEAETPVG